MSRSAEKEINDISDFSLFDDVATEHLDQIAAFAREEQYGKGEKIFDDHDLSEQIYLIKTGTVRIHLFSITPAYDITISRLHAGDILGEFALVESTDRSAAASCLEPVELYNIPIKELTKYLETHPEIGYQVMKNLGLIIANRVKQMNRRLLNLTRSSLF
jgi:CRP/FNR family transcriptional regulator